LFVPFLPLFELVNPQASALADLLPLAGSRHVKISNNSSPWAYCARLAANKPEENTRVPVKN
jgi:hypothetical protein